MTRFIYLSNPAPPNFKEKELFLKHIWIPFKKARQQSRLIHQDTFVHSEIRERERERKWARKREREKERNRKRCLSYIMMMTSSSTSTTDTDTSKSSINTKTDIITNINININTNTNINDSSNHNNDVRSVLDQVMEFLGLDHNNKSQQVLRWRLK